MPALNRCQLSAVTKQEPILLDSGQRAVNPRLTKVIGQWEAGPVTVNLMLPLPGRNSDGPASCRGGWHGGIFGRPSATSSAASDEMNPQPADGRMVSTTCCHRFSPAGASESSPPVRVQLPAISVKREFTALCKLDLLLLGYSRQVASVRSWHRLVCVVANTGSLHRLMMRCGWVALTRAASTRPRIASL